MSSTKEQAAAASARWRAKQPLAYQQARERYLKRKKGDGKPRLYFIQAASGPIKIGFTTKTPEGRLAELQAGNHEELKLLGVRLGTKAEEAALHEQFRHLKIRGEWFQPAPELLSITTV
jgi:T5orf172 domain